MGLSLGRDAEHTWISQPWLENRYFDMPYFIIKELSVVCVRKLKSSSIENFYKCIEQWHTSNESALDIIDVRRAQLKSFHLYPRAELRLRQAEATGGCSASPHSLCIRCR